MDSTLPMPLACPECAARMPETAAFCPGCGRSMTSPPVISTPAIPVSIASPPVAAETLSDPNSPTMPRAQGRVGYFPESIAGALAYFTLVPAIVFLFVEPYNKNRFVRFHSVQCLLWWVVGLATGAALKLISFVLFMIPVAGPLLALLLSVIIGLAALVIWLVLVVKALQGEMFKLPVVGDFAEQHAGSL